MHTRLTTSSTLWNIQRVYYVENRIQLRVYLANILRRLYQPREQIVRGVDHTTQRYKLRTSLRLHLTVCPMQESPTFTFNEDLRRHTHPVTHAIGVSPSSQIRSSTKSSISQLRWRVVIHCYAIYLSTTPKRIPDNTKTYSRQFTNHISPV